MIRWAAVGLFALTLGSLDVLVLAIAGDQVESVEALGAIAKIAAGGDALVIRIIALVLVLALLAYAVVQQQRDQAEMRKHIRRQTKATTINSRVMLLVVEHLRKTSLAPPGSKYALRLAELEKQLMTNGDDEDPLSSLEDD